MRLKNNYVKHMGFNPPTSVQYARSQGITLHSKQFFFIVYSFMPKT